MKREDRICWLKSKMKREDIVKAIPEDALEALCREYDIEEGEYPENDYEGCAVYSYFYWMKKVVEENEGKRKEEEAERIRLLGENGRSVFSIELVKNLRERNAEKCISIIDDLLTILEANRGWLYLGSRENDGFLRAMQLVKAERDTRERSKNE